MNLLRGEPWLSWKKPDLVEVSFVCVLCGLPLSNRANGSQEKEWGGSKHIWVLETNHPSPSLQPPDPQESPMGLEAESRTKPLLYMPLLKP